jgi:hypothetical protein
MRTEELLSFLARRSGWMNKNLHINRTPHFSDQWRFIDDQPGNEQDQAPPWSREANYP